MKSFLSDTTEQPPSLLERVWALPSTSPGRWSVIFIAVWPILLALGFAAISMHGGMTATRRTSMAAGGKFFSVPTVAIPFACSFLAAAAAFFVAVFAIVRRGERSILMLLPLILGGLATLFIVAEILE